MSIVLAFDEIPQEKIKNMPGGPDRPASTHYPFFRATADAPDAPTAYLVSYPPGDNSCAHFHQVDQFQILMKGKGTLGRHAVEPYYVHFSRAFTPYGPLHADETSGWTFLTLRARFDPGAQRLPRALPVLEAASGRKPWQVTTTAAFPACEGAINLRDLPDIRDDRGLFVKAVTMAPNTSMTAPSPAGGDGQFIIVVKGSMRYGGIERRAVTVTFLKRDEAAMHIEAGADGLEALILNFPHAAAHGVETTMATAPATGSKKWQCVLCAFHYDEAKGMPEDGIAPGTRWADVPESWTCPDCAAQKGDFQMVEIQ